MMRAYFESMIDRIEGALIAVGIVSIAAMCFGIAFYAFASQPVNASIKTESLETQRAREEARLTSMLRPPCVVNLTVQRHVRGCEELAQYIIKQANAAEAEQ